ncbi:acetyl-CoA carboxylase [Streptomyces sp. SAT1]|uniref:carboxyl transferase domain-containing protein n=1 Tax=Streptomyces sp. SAT1 TaxID=1849967 RepID=UPI0007DCF897|nr:carboxyl transferase domain-containing protein [Streptomyces sp. SAT1]ANH91385.1 acetyl-CoA carboxylase [Streptomyces sp. SAT1]
MAGRHSARQAIALVTDDFTELPDAPAPSGSMGAPDTAAPDTAAPHAAAPHAAAPRAAAPDRPDGPLGWEGYDASRARAAARTGEQESVVCGTARIEGTPAVLISFEFGFLGGSLGTRTGDRLEAAYAYARAHRLPVVPLVATGGSRMQEGMLALTQLQRVARQSALTRAAGLAQIAVLRDPTTGGGWATLGAGADVVLALPGAQVGFAGSRVRPPDADPAAYTAEAQVAAGSADAVVPPGELRATLGRWLRLLTAPSSAPAPPPRALPTAATATTATTATITTTTADTAATASTTATAAATGLPGTDLPATGLPATGWEAVRRARAPERPRAERYLDAYFSDRVALRGDRCGGGPSPETGTDTGTGTDTDAETETGGRGEVGGVLCGFGTHQGRTVAYAAQTGTATRPAGYRTAARLVRLADRLGIPVLTLVDTPGAANDAEAERQGAGAAIADLFGAVAAARTPVTTLVIGEGGSGGALALAAPGNTWAVPDSYFSVIAPELAAAILKRPPEQAPATAEQLRLRPQDLVELGVVRGVVEP